MGLFFSTPGCCSEALVEGLFIAFGWHYLSPSPPQPYLLPASRTNLCVFLLWASLSHSTFSWGWRRASIPGVLSHVSKVCETTCILLASSFYESLGNGWGKITFWIENVQAYLLPFIFSQDTVWDTPPQQELPGPGLFSLETQYWTICHWATPCCSVRMVAVVS